QLGFNFGARRRLAKIAISAPGPAWPGAETALSSVRLPAQERRDVELIVIHGLMHRGRPPMEVAALVRALWRRPLGVFGNRVGPRLRLALRRQRPRRRGRTVDGLWRRWPWRLR